MTAAEEVRKTRLAAAHLAEMEFTEGTIRVWTGNVTLNGDDGRDWLPVGNFGTLEFAKTTESFEANPLILGLRRSAVDNQLDYEAFITAMNAERGRDVYGLAVAVYIQLFDTVSGSQIEGPQPEFVGIMSHVETIRKDTTEAEVQLHCEGYFAEGRIPPNGLYTAAHQRALYAGDKGFDFIPANVDRQLTWPRD